MRIQWKWLYLNNVFKTWWRDQNGNIFRATGHLCGEFTGPGEFPPQRPVTRSVDVFFDQRMYKRLSKQPWGWWFETPSWSLWRHRNEQNPRGYDPNPAYNSVTPPPVFYHSPWLVHKQALPPISTVLMTQTLQTVVSETTYLVGNATAQTFYWWQKLDGRELPLANTGQ